MLPFADVGPPNPAAGARGHRCGGPCVCCRGAATTRTIIPRASVWFLRRGGRADGPPTAKPVGGPHNRERIHLTFHPCRPAGTIGGVRRHCRRAPRALSQTRCVPPCLLSGHAQKETRPRGSVCCCPRGGGVLPQQHRQRTTRAGLVSCRCHTLSAHPLLPAGGQCVSRIASVQSHRGRGRGEAGPDARAGPAAPSGPRGGQRRRAMTWASRRARSGAALLPPR